MNEPFELNANLSAGKKEFKVTYENEAYTLVESGSIAAVIKKNDGVWQLTTGSYNQSDADLIGKLIEEHQTK